MTTVEVVDDVAGLEALLPGWRRLADDVARTPFQLPEWHLAWWTYVGAYERHAAPHVVVVRDGDDVVGVAPFMTRGRGRLAELHFSTSPFADYHDVLAATPAAVDAVAAHVAAGRWSRVELDEVPPWGADTCARILPGAVREDATTCFPVAIEDVLTGRQGRLAVYAPKERRFRRAGDAELRRHVTPEAVAHAVPDFMAMHLREWRGLKHSGISFDRADMIRLYLGLPALMAPRRNLMLAELSLDGRSAAFAFGFVFRGTFWEYRTAFEPELRRMSPGYVLRRMLLARLREDGFESFDLLRGDYEYKRNFVDRGVANARFRQEPERATAPAPTAPGDDRGQA